MKNILIISAEGFEDLELFYPYHRLKEEKFSVVVASNKEKITGKHGYSIKVDKLFSEVNPKDFDALVIPGGKGPEQVRLNKDALKIAKHFVENNKPVAFICHGVQVLISVNALKGRKATCWYGVKDDLIAAGGIFLDQEVVVDGNFVSARHPGDLASWMREFIKVL